MRILIAGDLPILRHGIRNLLQTAIEGVEVAEVSSVGGIFDALDNARWDLLILDLAAPGDAGIGVLRQLVQSHSTTPVVVLSTSAEEELGALVLQAGAAGYLQKCVPLDCIVEAVKRVSRGGTYFSSTLMMRLMRELRHQPAAKLRDMLSLREQQVSRLITAGKTRAEIATQLSVSPKTVSTFRSRLLRKLRLKNDAQLVQYWHHRDQHFHAM